MTSSKITFTLQKVKAVVLEELFPGWEEAVQEERFAVWLNAQPRAMRKLAESDSVVDALTLLTAYKERNTLRNIAREIRRRYGSKRNAT